jgi:tetratricopeptide (TPR) repeat protein
VSVEVLPVESVESEGGSVKTCYVSIPFGIKSDRDGLLIDFDSIYTQAIKPAVEGAGLTCLRADELPAGALIQKSIISAVLGSDVMIADLTTANANVMYELGIRHAVQRGLTLLLTATQRPIPFDINYSKTIMYELGGNGLVTDQSAQSLRQMIGSAIRAGLEHASVDSPLYEFFPDLHVDLPGGLASFESRRRLPTKRAKRSRSRSETLSSREEPREAVKRVEAEALNTPDADPVTLVNVLKAYRDISAWDDVIELADALPPTIGDSPEVRQLLALALNRRAKPGDQDRAILLMKQLIAETGGDAESFGILGRIYKDRYAADERQEDLDTAIMYYKQGFEKQPADYYPGVNVVTLLLQRKGEAARQELEAILPKVREAVENKMKDGLKGYWELATALHLACVAQEWDEAQRLAELAIEQSPSRWMLESTIRDLVSVHDAMNEADREKLRAIVNFLRLEGLEEEGRNA